MNGILARMGLKQLVLILLALVAVIAVLADLGGAFWTAWWNCYKRPGGVSMVATSPGDRRGLKRFQRLPKH
jgi:hypothetical protein